MDVSIMAAIGLSWALASDPAGSSRLEEGIRQYREGLLSEAISSLDAALQHLARETPSRRDSLVRAHVFKGAALVGTGQEEPAKAEFRRALALEPPLRLARGELPDRVIRVFEAARTGKHGSVMQRPSDVPRKAGLGAAGIAAIAGGAALLVGGAAVAASGSGPAASPSPSPSPTPDPRVVVPLTNTGPGQIVFVAADPAPGTTFVGCAGGPSTCASRLQMAFRVRVDSTEYREYSFTVALYDATDRLCLWNGIPSASAGFLRWPSGVFQDVVLDFQRPVTCALPFTATEMLADVQGWLNGANSRSVVQQRWRLSYTFER